MEPAWPLYDDTSVYGLSPTEVALLRQIVTAEVGRAIAALRTRGATAEQIDAMADTLVLPAFDDEEALRDVKRGLKDVEYYEAQPVVQDTGFVIMYLSRMADMQEIILKAQAVLDRLAVLARDSGATWGELGRAIDISTEAARQRWSDRGVV